jgi:hypothetical protein
LPHDDFTAHCRAAWDSFIIYYHGFTPVEAATAVPVSTYRVPTDCDISITLVAEASQMASSTCQLMASYARLAYNLPFWN